MPSVKQISSLDDNPENPSQTVLEGTKNGSIEVKYPKKGETLFFQVDLMQEAQAINGIVIILDSSRPDFEKKDTLTVEKIANGIRTWLRTWHKSQSPVSVIQTGRKAEIEHDGLRINVQFVSAELVRVSVYCMTDEEINLKYQDPSNKPAGQPSI